MQDFESNATSGCVGFTDFFSTFDPWIKLVDLEELLHKLLGESSLTASITERNWQPQPQHLSHGISYASSVLDIVFSLQWMRPRLHMTKYIRDKSLFIAQALLPSLKMACQTAFWRFEVSYESFFDAESKWCIHLIVAQPTRVLCPEFSSILPLPKLEKLVAPNFGLNKDNITDESTLANALAPCCFLLSLDV